MQFPTRLATAVEIARVVRRMTGSGYRKMTLLGCSSGLFTGFALLDQESQLPPGRRSISAYIPLDYDYQTDDPEEQQAWCGEIPYLDEQMAAGVYANPNMLPVFGLPALEDPEGMSQIPGFGGLTNLQVALSVAAWPSAPGLPGHFAAGIFNEFGIAVGLHYTAVPTLIDFLVQCSPTYEPLQFRQDTNKVVCADYDTPWESNLSSIRVPIFYTYAAGGFSTAYECTASVLGSDDITFHEVWLHPVGEEALDYGHLDLFIAQNAPETTWGPMATWIVAHTE